MSGPRVVTAGRRRLAWIIAIAADGMQLALLPVFATGIAWPISDAIDLVVGATMLVLLGWHFAFLPSFAVKLLPVVDIVPTWTMAVWLATRKSAPPASPVPGAPPPPEPPAGLPPETPRA
jgi:hypothetical protein